MAKILKKLLKNPIRNIPVFIISLLIIYFIGRMLYLTFGIITLAGYIIICFYGMVKIINKPKRIFVWAFGVILGAIALKILIENFIPSVSGTEKDLLSSGIILAVIILLFMKSKSFKKS